MNKNEWIDEELLQALEVEGTNAHRLCTIGQGWAERFGRDVLISFRTDTARDCLVEGVQPWSSSVDFPIARIFGRFLPRKNEERETPRLLSGETKNLQAI